MALNYSDINLVCESSRYARRVQSSEGILNSPLAVLTSLAVQVKFVELTTGGH